MKLIFKQRLFSWLDSYDIYDEQGNVVFTVKDVFRFTDTYVLDIGLPQDSLYVVMLVLAIDAEKCSRD